MATSLGHNEPSRPSGTGHNGYQHSKTFEALKATKERIPENLTTSQYLRMLDIHLFRAISPIVTNTNWMDQYLPKIMVWQVANPRRKIVMSRSIDYASLITRFLLSTDYKERLTLFEELRFDRAVVLQGIRSFLFRLENYVKACNLELEVPERHAGMEIEFMQTYCKRVEESLQAKSSLIAIITDAKHHLDAALDFRDQILEKYTRLVLVSAQRDYANFFNCDVPLDDIIQTYRVCAQRAVDKCDSTQGVLTTHIQAWLKTGKTSVNKQRLEEIARRREVRNLTENTEAAALEDFNSRAQQADHIQHIQHLARLADPKGYARLKLGITEILPAASKKLLVTFS